ncbi:hypothetical protein LMG27952_06604 [Paraburkholderia hiiakae]|uniref:Uncharacterized protein n=1 Tax=Paraburkholderia hiiakae TaxID=1081782 RepID=A0ABN7IFN7_9BURK|nr:hypothetical protein LMG27952_06604 [Paraburkholderia hiiakae]
MSEYAIAMSRPDAGNTDVPGVLRREGWPGSRTSPNQTA